MRLTKREQVSQFMKSYETKIESDRGCEWAYEMAEIEWAEEFDKRMYKDYLSFRAARTYWKKFSKSFHSVR